MLFKQRVKKSKKKKRRKKAKMVSQNFTFNFTINAFLLFFPLIADNLFPSSLFHNQEEKDREVKTNEFLA